jgi:hypothetical protein
MASGFLRSAVHASAGVPRLYRAALRAGVGPLGAVEVVTISAGAAAAASRHGAGVPGRQNALRHFTWQALLSARFGVEVARSIAHAQESGTANEADSRVDRHNNAVGQEYGAAHASDLRRGSSRAALERAARAGLAKWDADELRWVRAH